MMEESEKIIAERNNRMSSHIKRWVLCFHEFFCHSNLNLWFITLLGIVVSMDVRENYFFSFSTGCTLDGLLSFSGCANGWRIVPALFWCAIVYSCTWCVRGTWCSEPCHFGELGYRYAVLITCCFSNSCVPYYYTCTMSEV